MAGTDEIVRTTVCLGQRDGDSWQPVGCGFLLVDQTTMWLVTCGSVLDRAKNTGLSAWVSRKGNGVLLDVQHVLEGAGLEWLRAEQGNLAACVVPMHPDWDIKALPSAAALPAGQLPALLPVHGVAFPYGIDGFEPRNTLPIVLSGEIAGSDTERSRVYCDLPMLPLNEGAPLLAFAGEGAKRKLVLVGVMTGTLPISSQVPPHLVPAALASLSMATPIHVAIDLICSPAGEAQRNKAEAAAARAVN
ncbi:MAG: hypothetical protein ACI91B_001105 [Planctomycetota bacterium]|jgi:hypothetical protein